MKDFGDGLLSAREGSFFPRFSQGYWVWHSACQYFVGSHFFPYASSKLNLFVIWIELSSGGSFRFSGVKEALFFAFCVCVWVVYCFILCCWLNPLFIYSFLFWCFLLSWIFSITLFANLCFALIIAFAIKIGGIMSPQCSFCMLWILFYYCYVFLSWASVWSILFFYIFVNGIS